MLLTTVLVTQKQRGLLAFEGNTITANGHDGIVDIILRLISRVDMNHLEKEQKKNSSAQTPCAPPGTDWGVLYQRSFNEETAQEIGKVPRGKSNSSTSPFITDYRGEKKRQHWPQAWIQQVYETVNHETNRAVAVLLLVGLTWLLANSLFGGESGSSMRSFFTGASEKPTAAESRPRKYKCGLSAPCPAKHLAFRLVSGAANVIGPKICLEDKMLVSSVKNNVGRGLNIALVNDISDLLKYLRPLHEGTLVFVASFDDAATKMNDESRRLFEELGSTAVKELAFRDSWVFVGAKGIEKESRMKNTKSSNKYEGWPESLEMDGCIPLRPPLEG
ncbi:hypothetical protein F7725_000665 [Dissostichus mawsoni]|uniref:ILEI/PANDER domain-containing protein n=1 Tax=Dissostichus mawsoni TaxID=36200 RepID=A0A7J5ZFM0_DISMA|nr:hypothetical protein F7725_000665 [Dissostichus mawsoni]